MAKRVKKFQKELKALNKEVTKRGEDFFKEVMFEMLLQASSLTRVDTGLARSSWNIGIDFADQGITGKHFSKDNAEVDSLEFAKKHGKDKIENLKLGDKGFLSNHVEYIEALNNGGDNKKGDFMVEAALHRVSKQFV